MKKLLKPIVEANHGVTYAGMINMLKLLLAYEKWCNNANPKNKVELAEPSVTIILVPVKLRSICIG